MLVRYIRTREHTNPLKRYVIDVPIDISSPACQGGSTVSDRAVSLTVPKNIFQLTIIPWIVFLPLPETVIFVVTGTQRKAGLN